MRLTETPSNDTKELYVGYGRSAELKSQDGQPVHSTEDILGSYQRLLEIHKAIVGGAGRYWNWPGLATTTRPSLGRILHQYELYQQILDVPGVICEFGTHFGTGASLWTSLRGILEPHNSSRRIYVFDTFDGFRGAGTHDGASSDGDFSLPEDFATLLEELLTLQRRLSGFASDQAAPMHQIYVGDVGHSVPRFIEEHPEATIAMAVLDLDLFAPTTEVLEKIRPRLTVGSVIVLDEFNCPTFPGETSAALDAGVAGLRLVKSRHAPYSTWARVDAEFLRPRPLSHYA